MEPKLENLEAVLRGAPAPRPPADLKAQLIRACRDQDVAPEVHRPARRLLEADTPRWRRWSLFLMPAGIAAALATGLVVQQDTIRDLREELHRIEAAPTSTDAQPSAASTVVATGLPDEIQEIERLRKVLAQLEREVAEVRALEAENARLKEALGRAHASLPPEFRELNNAKEKAERIHCVNNLKQLGLAARIYANDNDDTYPQDVAAMAKHMGTPKICVCPGDTTRTAAESWDTFTPARMSYEYFAPAPGKQEFEPTRVLFRCSIHGNIGLYDGSVHMGIALEHPERIVNRNGALFFENTVSGSVPGPAPASGAAPGGGGGSVPATGAQPTFHMSPELARRYGLIPVEPPPSTNGAGAPVAVTTEVRVVRDDAGQVLTEEEAGVIVVVPTPSAETGESGDAGEESKPEPTPAP